MKAALRWLADHTPGSAELLRLMDATPVACGQSAVTVRRSDLSGYAGYEGGSLPDPAVFAAAADQAAWRRSASSIISAHLADKIISVVTGPGR